MSCWLQPRVGTLTDGANRARLFGLFLAVGLRSLPVSMPLDTQDDGAAVWIQARTRGVLARRQRDQDAALRATVHAAKLKRRAAIEEKYKNELASEMTRKIESKASDKVTIRKDGLLCAVALCGIAGQVVDAVWMLKLPQSYAWGGPPLRLCLSFFAGLLVIRLADYYAYLFEAQRLQLPPAFVSFLQARCLPLRHLLLLLHQSFATGAPLALAALAMATVTDTDGAHQPSTAGARPAPRLRARGLRRAAARAADGATPDDPAAPRRVPPRGLRGRERQPAVDRALRCGLRLHLRQPRLRALD